MLTAAGNSPRKASKNRLAKGSTWLGLRDHISLYSPVLNHSSHLHGGAGVPGGTTPAARATHSVTALAIRAAGERRAKAAMARERADLGSGGAHARGAWRGRATGGGASTRGGLRSCGGGSRGRARAREPGRQTLVVLRGGLGRNGTAHTV
jgi:hypothetical protein